VRLGLAVAVGGIGLVLSGAGSAAGTLAILAVEAAIIAWELLVQGRALAGRVRTSRVS
jgi:hypothetical protein